MSGETQNGQDGISLSMAEMSVLQEFEELLQASGSLNEGDTLPVELKDQSDRTHHDIGFVVENNAVVALSARYCALKALPSSIDQLSSLRELDLTGNQLATLPESLGNLARLKELHLMNNGLVALPESLGKLELLKELRLCNNRLTSLPTSVGNLIRLTILDLRNNRLPTLPASLRTLNNLTMLDVRANRFVSLPGSIGELEKLEKIDLRWNQLSPSYPEPLEQLEQRGCVIYT